MNTHFDRAGAVRKPTIVCPECKGACVVYFYRTLDPYEKRKSDDCEKCGGIGEVPDTDKPSRPYRPNSLVNALTSIIRMSIRLVRAYENEGNASEVARLRDNIEWYVNRRRRELEGR